jgi:hypothetical protein
LLIDLNSREALAKSKFAADSRSFMAHFIFDNFFPLLLSQIGHLRSSSPVSKPTTAGIVPHGRWSGPQANTFKLIHCQH